MSDPATFPEMLRRVRTARRISQSKLAARAGFDHSYVSRLEQGARTPTREAVGQLADALELVPVDRYTLFASAGFLPDNMPEGAMMFGALAVSGLADRDAVIASLIRHTNTVLRERVDRGGNAA